MKVAFIGAGYMAQEHVRAFAGLPSVELAGIHSRSRERAEALAAAAGIERVCDSIDALHEEAGAELVVVTVPELSANAVAKACFRHPWTVLLEKPAGYDLADAEDILAAAKAAGAKAYVALNRRAHASTRAAQEMLEGTGERLIVVQDQEDMEAALKAGQPELVVRNWMFANSIHVIDYLRQFGRGEIVEVTPSVPWNADKPGFVVATVTFSSGDVGVYQGVWNAPGPWSVAITTAEKRLEMRPVEQLTVQPRGSRAQDKVELGTVDTDFKPGLRVQAQAAIDAAAGKPTTLATLEDATESMRLCARIFGLA